MKKVIFPVIAVAFLCSACGVRVKADYQDQTTSTAQINTSNYSETAQIWGDDSRWATTPDGFPVW